MAEKEQPVRDLGIIPNREESVRKLVKKLNEGGAWAACYEAGPTGYTLYWQLTKLGVPCMMIAPTLVPTKRSRENNWRMFVACVIFDE